MKDVEKLEVILKISHFGDLLLKDISSEKVTYLGSRLEKVLVFRDMFILLSDLLSEVCIDCDINDEKFAVFFSPPEEINLQYYADFLRELRDMCQGFLKSKSPFPAGAAQTRADTLYSILTINLDEVSDSTIPTLDGARY